MTQVSGEHNPQIPPVFGRSGDVGDIAAELLRKHCEQSASLYWQTYGDLRDAGIRHEEARAAARAFLPEAMNGVSSPMRVLA